MMRWAGREAIPIKFMAVWYEKCDGSPLSAATKMPLRGQPSAVVAFPSPALNRQSRDFDSIRYTAEDLQIYPVGVPQHGCFMQLALQSYDQWLWEKRVTLHLPAGLGVLIR